MFIQCFYYHLNDGFMSCIFLAGWFRGLETTNTPSSTQSIDLSPSRPYFVHLQTWPDQSAMLLIQISSFTNNGEVPSKQHHRLRCQTHAVTVGISEALPSQTQSWNADAQIPRAFENVLLSALIILQMSVTDVNCGRCQNGEERREKAGGRGSNRRLLLPRLSGLTGARLRTGLPSVKFLPSSLLSLLHSN